MSTPICPQCGAVLISGGKFCVNCGASVETVSPVAPGKEAVQDTTIAADVPATTVAEETGVSDTPVTPDAPDKTEETAQENLPDVQEEAVTETGTETIEENITIEVAEAIVEAPTDSNDAAAPVAPVSEPVNQTPVQSEQPMQPLYAAPVQTYAAPVQNYMQSQQVVPPAQVYAPQQVFCTPVVLQEPQHQKRRFGAKEGARVRAKVGFFRRTMIGFLAIFLCLFTLITMLVYDIRNFSTQKVLERSIKNLSLSAIPEENFNEILDEAGIAPLLKNSKLDSLINDLYTGKGNTVITADDIVDFLDDNRNYLENEFGLDINLAEIEDALEEVDFEKVSSEDLRDLLDDSPISTLIAAKISSVFNEVVNGEETLSRKEVQKMVKNISEYLDDEFDVTLPVEVEEQVAEFFTDSEIFEDLKADTIKDNAPIVHKVLQIGFSIYLIVFLLVICLFWMLLMFLCGRCSWTRAAKSIGITIMIPGLIFTLATGIAEALPAVWTTLCGNITVISFASSTLLIANAPVSIGVLAAGILLLICGMVFSRIFRKVDA